MMVTQHMPHFTMYCCFHMVTVVGTRIFHFVAQRTTLNNVSPKPNSMHTNFRSDQIITLPSFEEVTFYSNILLTVGIFGAE